MEKPDWALWVNVPSVTLEECVCLSLDSEPEVEQHVPFSGGVHIFRYGDTKFTGVLNTEKGKKRLATLRKHFDARSRLLPPFGWPDYYGNYSEKRVRLGDFADWAYTQGWEVPARIDVTPKPAPAIAEPAPVVEAPASETPEPPAPPVVAGNAPEPKEQRQDRRLHACEKHGLVMPKSYLRRLPDGVGDVADREGVTRQAFSIDVKAALQRRESAIRDGQTVHRT